MALYKIGVRWTEIYSGQVYIEADSKEEALNIVETDKVKYQEIARENTSDGYEGLSDIDVVYRGIEKDKDMFANNNEEDDI